MVSNAVRYASQWGSLTREETPPPCVCTESWQTWRLNNFETPSFCLFVTPRLWLHPHSPLNMCCLPLQHFPPFHAHVDESRSDPKLWLRCESQLMTCLWVTWHSTSCTATLQEKKKKLVQEYVLIRVPDDRHYWKAVTKMMTFLNGVQLCRNELPILPCPLILNLLC